MADTDQKKKVYHEQQTEDDVLRRMLNTPPKPHKEQPKKGRKSATGSRH